MRLQVVASNDNISAPAGDLPALTGEDKVRIMEILRREGGSTDAFFLNFCYLTGMSPEQAAALTVRRTDWRKSPSGDFNTTLARTNLLSYIIGRESVQGELAPDDPVFVTGGRPFCLAEFMNRLERACALAGIPCGSSTPKGKKQRLHAVH